jgi:hypothetical protein
MSIRRSRGTRTATVLVGVAAAVLTGAVGATAAPNPAADGVSPAAEPVDEGASRGDSLPDRAIGVDWPAELTEHTRLFVNPYRSYLVTIRNGVPTLALSTGWDSCWFMTQRHGVLRYPC